MRESIITVCKVALRHRSHSPTQSFFTRVYLISSFTVVPCHFWTHCDSYMNLDLSVQKSRVTVHFLMSLLARRVQYQSNFWLLLQIWYWAKKMLTFSQGKGLLEKCNILWFYFLAAVVVAFSSLSVFKQINKYIYPALIYFSLVFFKQRWWRTDHFITETASCALPLYPATHTNQTAAHCCRPSCLTETVAKPLLSITHSIRLPTADLPSISQIDFMTALLFLYLSVFFPPYSSQLYCVAGWPGWLNLCCAFTVLNTSIGVVCAVVWFCFGVFLHFLNSFESKFDSFTAARKSHYHTLFCLLMHLVLTVTGNTSADVYGLHV